MANQPAPINGGQTETKPGRHQKGRKKAHGQDPSSAGHEQEEAIGEEEEEEEDVC